MVEKQNFTKYERSRIVGARGLQISMDAPLLVKLNKEELEGVNYDPLKIAEKELDSGVLPISVNKPLPKRVEDDVKKIRVEDNNLSDEEKIKTEKEEEKFIREKGLVQLSDSEEEREEFARNIEEEFGDESSLDDTEDLD